jgi:hypothetical protein
VSYDLGGPETSSDYRKIRDHMQTFGTRAKPLESFWLVETDKNCATLRDEIVEEADLDLNDKLLVLTWSVGNWASYGMSKDINDWLKGRS